VGPGPVDDADRPRGRLWHSPAMPDRPRLPARHRPLRRGDGRVQLGVGDDVPALAGVGPGEFAVLERLDGTHTFPDLYAVAAAHGCTPESVDELVGLLRGHGLLADPTAERLAGLRAPGRTPLPSHAGEPPVWGARIEAVVGGRGPLAESVVRAVRAAVRDHPAVHLTVGEWALSHAELELRTPGQGEGAARPHRAPPTIVVLTAYAGLDPTLPLPWLRSGITHLPVVAEPGRITLGPLVRPPLGTRGVCLQCVELHRADRDPDRASVLAQTLRPAAGTIEPSAALREAAAALAALVVASHLAGHSLPPGVTVELSQPWPRIDHRRWEPHPHCPGHGHPGARETMAG
jgi:hypothetical protein